MEKYEKLEKEKSVTISAKVKPKRFHNKKRSSKEPQYEQEGGDSNRLPPELYKKLRKLFSQIEAEFENLYIENQSCE